MMFGQQPYVYQQPIYNQSPMPQMQEPQMQMRPQYQPAPQMPTYQPQPQQPQNQSIIWIPNEQAALMQQLNAMQMQAANCCCENRASIAQVRYDMATQACDTRNTVQNTTRDIIDAMNCGFRSIDQRLTAQELAAKDAKIAEQNQQLFVAQLAASQNAQTLDLRNYVSGQLAYYNPRPVPAFSVPAPYQYAGCNSGYNYGCGNCA